MSRLFAPKVVNCTFQRANFEHFPLVVTHWNGRDRGSAHRAQVASACRER